MSNVRLTTAEFKRRDQLLTMKATVERRGDKKALAAWKKKYGAELAALEAKHAKANEPSESEKQAQVQYDSIRDIVAALECDYDRLEELRGAKSDYQTCDLTKPLTHSWAQVHADEAEELAELEDAAGECKSRDDAEQRIQEDALSVEVRNDWHCPGGSGDSAPTDFKILLYTGGPACQIRGELNEHCEPVRAWIEHQDWGTPWTQLLRDREGNLPDEDTLLTYARCFYFGEG